MKLVVFLIFFVLGAMLSCGKKKEPELLVVMTPEGSQVLETDGYSCLNKLARLTDTDIRPDLAAPTLSFKKMTIEWTKDTPLYIQVVKLIIRGAGVTGGEQTCTFGVDEITALFEHAGNPSFVENTITAKGTYTSNPNCRVTCGSLSLADSNDVAINASGQLIVKATEEDGDTFRRVQATGSVQITP